MTATNPDFDFNKTGVQYKMDSQTIRSLPSGGLRDEGLAYYEGLILKIAELKQTSVLPNEVIDDALGCTHHFETYLQQMLRFTGHIEAIERIVRGQISPEYPITIIREVNSQASSSRMIAVASKPIEYDFILLLLVSVALLERTATFLYAQLLGKTGRDLNYFKLKSELAQSSDHRAIQIRSSINLVDGLISNILVTDTQKSLRNKIAHLSSVPELTKNALTIHQISDKKYLVLDQDIVDFPVFGSAYRIAQSVPFIVMTAISNMIGYDSLGNAVAGTDRIRDCRQSYFEPAWSNPAVDKNKYISNSPDAMRVSVLNVGVNSNDINIISLSPSVLSAAMTI